jgi:hypothetical protein
MDCGTSEGHCRTKYREYTRFIKKGVIYYMASNELKADNRGSFAINQWQDLKKNGGIAYSPEQLEQIFKRGSDDVTYTREEVQSRIINYFQSCISLVTDEETGETNYLWKSNPTKVGLSLALDISKDTLTDYVKGVDRHGNLYKQNGFKKKQKIATEDFDLIERAFAIVEQFYEGQLALNKNNSGSIFWLLNSQNNRWSNQQDISVSTPDTTERLTASQLPRLDNFNDTKVIDVPTRGVDLPILKNESED